LEKPIIFLFYENHWRRFGFFHGAFGGFGQGNINVASGAAIFIHEEEDQVDDDATGGRND
jgi:hypothetical protein